MARAALAALLVLAGCGPAPSLTANIDVEEARRLTEQSRKLGYITDFTCLGNEASVTPQFWNTVSAKSKQGVVLSLAKLCDAENSGNRMTVKDSQSGKTLASYDGGLKVTFH